MEPNKADSEPAEDIVVHGIEFYPTKDDGVYRGPYGLSLILIKSNVVIVDRALGEGATPEDALLAWAHKTIKLTDFANEVERRIEKA